MDIEGAFFTGAPAEDWPRICAAALLMARDEDRIDVAFPDAQADQVARHLEGLAAESTESAAGTVRIVRSPHRLGWTRLEVEVLVPVDQEVD